jgi:hypothetical protein
MEGRISLGKLLAEGNLPVSGETLLVSLQNVHFHGLSLSKQIVDIRTLLKGLRAKSTVQGSDLNEESIDVFTLFCSTQTPVSPDLCRDTYLDIQRLSQLRRHVQIMICLLSFVQVSKDLLVFLR